MTSRPDADSGPDAPPDARLIAAHDLARAALLEITPDASIGDPVEYSVEEDGVVSLRFENRLAGYPGWFWTVSLARLDDADPTVLEVELLPGETALLAPEWTPWAQRLADYQAQQRATAEASLAADVDDEDDEELDDADDEELDDEDLDDVDDLDAADFDGDGSPILHAGDLDGVDIDELAGDDDELDDDEFDDGEPDDDGDEDDEPDR